MFFENCGPMAGLLAEEAARMTENPELRDRAGRVLQKLERLDRRVPDVIKYAGSGRGFDAASDYPQVFERLRVGSDGHFREPPESDKVLYLDGSDLIPEHNKAWQTPEASRMILTVIQRFAPSRAR